MIGVTPHRWGVVGHLRIEKTWWHFKAGVWKQHDTRVSTRHQAKHLHRPPRYVNVYRFHVSQWKSSHGKQGRPRVFGAMIYLGGRHHRFLDRRQGG